MLKERFYKNKIIYFFFVSILFLGFPFISILFQIFFILISNSRNKYFFYIIIFFISTYLGLINITKVPEVDLKNYYDWFQLAGNLSLKEFVLFNQKGPIFNLLTYFLFYLFRGNNNLYIFTLTFFTYFLLLIAVYKFYKYTNSYGFIIVLALVVVGFFPQLFTLSGNIIRQILAGSLLFLFIIYRLFYNRNIWILLILSIFIHLSVLLFIPFIFLNGVIKKFNIKKVILLPAIILFIFLIYKPIISFFVNKINNPIIDSVFQRLLRYYPSLYNTPALSGIILVILLLIIIIYQAYYRNIINLELIDKYRHFTMLYIAFCLVFFFTFNITEISHRIVFYAYYFFPFVFPFLIIRKNNTFNIILASFLIFCFLVYFIVKIDNSVWTYAPSERIFGDLMLYIFFNY